MTPFAAVAVKTVGAAGAAALLSLALAGGLAQAASNPTPTPSASTKAPATDHRTDRRAIARAVFESEAEVLGITPKTLREDLRKGQKVSDLARDKGMTKEQFETKLIAGVKPRLAALVDHKVITQAQADKVIDRISKGYVPFWDGLHRATPSTK
jgi:membrane-bound lytic murein transglycosylase B